MRGTRASLRPLGASVDDGWPMSPTGRRLAIAASFVLASLCLPRPAPAQWYVAGYAGGNYTHPADVRVDSPLLGVSLTAEDVRFTAEPLRSPQYYGYRLGRWLAPDRRLAIELEFIHLKVIGQTQRSYRLRGTVDGVAVPAVGPLDPVVERYAMTHGLNFAVLNLMYGRPLSDRVTLVLRGGGGVTIPHAETTIQGIERELYEMAGPGAHGAAGVDVRLAGRTSLLVEYKVTWAEPGISVAGGTGRTTSVTHHAAVGFAFGIAR
jgi:hypothetical protein